MLRFRIAAASVALLGFALSSSAQTGFKVVAHSGVSASSLTSNELSQIFLKKVEKFSDGAPAVPVDQSTSSSVRETFSEAVHGKTASAVDAYWQKRIFSGRGLPPTTYGSDAQVVNFVRATPGAIGYVSPAAPAEGVKVIAVR